MYSFTPKALHSAVLRASVVFNEFSISSFTLNSLVFSFSLLLVVMK